MRGTIYLEDGSIYRGKGFGAVATTTGELVFQTGMTGYQMTLTDPSYEGQVIVFTYPLLGNYGINSEDNESEGIHAAGVVASDICFHPSNWQSEKDIDTFLREEGIPGVYGVDTRELTRRIRKGGSLRCVITTEEKSLEELENLCREAVYPGDAMKTAGVREVKRLEAKEGRYEVAVLDFGVKKSILDELLARGCNLTLYPYGTKARIILADKPDGVFLSNGPGDPEEAEEAISIVDKLVTNSHYGSEQMPIFGICMGHQILALSQGGSTYKMKYGHRGANHGVFDKMTGRSYITSQNHGYAVLGDSITLKGLETTHFNLNDGTVEGLRHLSKPVFSVQFHPESSPGPNDTGYLFDRFISLMEGGRL